ncbi:MAG: hypothetical protein H0U27_07895 [Nitrosopumilus sp.]|nr:hypothetical protein [Nitrosopumilus sp.]
MDSNHCSIKFSVGTTIKVDESVSVIAFIAIIVLPAPVGKIMQPLLSFSVHLFSASF